MYLIYCLMLIALMVFGGTHAFADGLKPDSAGYRQIKALDERLFQAYKNCDLATLGDLVASSLQVYPMESYGAIELGEQYRLTRVVSYDHLSDWQRKSL